MAGLVNQRIAAFEEMAGSETVEAKHFPVPKCFVGKLISFYEHEVPTKAGEAANNSSQAAKLVDEVSKAPTTPSEGSSYWTARSLFEGNDLAPEKPRNDAFQKQGSQRIVPAAGEDEETRMRRSRFIFHINAPATNISEAIARAQRGRGLPRVEFFLSKGIKILQNATEARSASSTAKEDSHTSRDKTSPARNTGGVKILARTITSADPSTSLITPTRSENGDESEVGLSVDAAEGKRIARKAKERSTSSSSSNQASQKLGFEKSSADNTGSIRKFAKKIGKPSSPENAGSVSLRTRNTKKVPRKDPGYVDKSAKAVGEKSPALNSPSLKIPVLNLGRVRNTATTDGRGSSAEKTRNVCKRTKADVERSSGLNTGSGSIITKKKDKTCSPEDTGSVSRMTMTDINNSGVTGSGSTSKTAKADGNNSLGTNMGSFCNATKKQDEKSLKKNTEKLCKRIKTEDRKSLQAKKTSVRNNMRKDQSTSTVTHTRSEGGSENRIDLSREGSRRRIYLFSKLRAKLRERRGRRRGSQQGIAVHQLSRRVSSKSTATIPIEVNVPYPKDSRELDNSFTATIQLKVSLTRNNE